MAPSPTTPPLICLWLRRSAGLARRGFPFLPRGGDSPMGRVRAAARIALFATRPAPLRWLLRLVMTLLWPFGAVAETLHVLATLPAADRPIGGVGAWAARAGDMLTLALADNVSPREYRLYRLHRPEQHRVAGAYLYASERSLFPMLNRRRGANPELVQDKARFAHQCQEHGLPCIPTLAVYRAGRQTAPAVPFIPDAPALWVKDLAGSRGSGAAGWRRTVDGADVLYADSDGRRLTPAALAEAWRSSGRALIVQPCITHHPALTPLSDGPLVDVRVVSGRATDGTVTVIAALAALPWRDDAGRRRHIPAVVDLATGRLRHATLDGLRPLSHHPATGTALDGFPLPDWPACLALVRRAHGEAFAHFVFLGWDVALTAAGPLLIEVNSGWDATPHQRFEDRPLGLGPFATIALQHLETPPCA